jgi:hypothetical protein
MCAFLLFPIAALSDAKSGKIIELTFASSAQGAVRQGTAQFAIEGGFSQFGDCNTTWAGVMKK